MVWMVKKSPRTIDQMQKAQLTQTISSPLSYSDVHVCSLYKTNYSKKMEKAIAIYITDEVIIGTAKLLSMEMFDYCV